MHDLTDEDPRQVGHYVLESRLGTGGMGTVYLGRSRGGRRVAVKVVATAHAHERTFRDRFRREVEAMRRVGSFWTAAVVDADPDAARPWVATEYIEGPTLGDFVEQKGPVTGDRFWELALALTEALASVHAVGVVHRDLKPGNILLAPDGPRLIDFGISRVLEQSSLTATGMTIGTPAFMSPEQVAAAQITTASDMFSLASVLAFAASGTTPFGNTHLGAAFYNLLHTEADLAAVPTEIRDFLVPCFSKDPRARPTAEELLTTFAIRHGATAPTPQARQLPAPAVAGPPGQLVRAKAASGGGGSGQSRSRLPRVLAGVALIGMAVALIVLLTPLGKGLLGRAGGEDGAATTRASPPGAGEMTSSGPPSGGASSEAPEQRPEESEDYPDIGMISMSPDWGPVAAETTVHGVGFDSCAHVDIKWLDWDDTYLDGATEIEPDADGTISVPIEVPDVAPEQAYTVEAWCFVNGGDVWDLAGDALTEFFVTG